jgi:acyl-CoA thioesterase
VRPGRDGGHNVVVSPPVASSAFARHTSVRPVGDGRYQGTIDRSWWIVAGPNGGYVAALVLRAVQQELGPDAFPVRTASFHYLRPPGEGPVEVQVVVERRGRTVQSATARMHQDGRLLVIAIVHAGAGRPDAPAFDDDPGLPPLHDGRPVPPPEQVAPPADLDPERDVPMRGHYDLRWVLGSVPFEPAPQAGEPRAHCGGWIRFTEPTPLDAAALTAITDAWMPPVFSRLGVPLAVPTVDLTVHLRNLPTDDSGWCFIETVSPVASDGYLVEHARIHDRNGVLLAESRQLAVVA